MSLASLISWFDRGATRAVALVCIAAVPLAEASAAEDFAVIRIASGLSNPVSAAAPPGDNQRLFFVEKDLGRIRILDLNTGQIAPTPFLTVDDIRTGSERGLLGLAFHPSFATNGFFFVNLTDGAGHTDIRRYQVTGNPATDNADPDSKTIVLEYDQPFGNHNGGWIGFGPDNFLYIASGDGGSGNDPLNSGQRTNTLLGKMLRIDVNGDDFPSDGRKTYAIPPRNPFVDMDGDDEIWAYGLRNPWRASFDRVTGDLYIADVGQNNREEVNFQPATSTGGENYGWRLREGLIDTRTGGVGGPLPTGAINPIYDYERGFGTFRGNSVTGGYVYRGPAASLRGHYVFADIISNQIWSFPVGTDPFQTRVDRTTEFAPDVGAINHVSSFAEDPSGNVYVIDHTNDLFDSVGNDGEIYLISSTVAASVPIGLPALAAVGALFGLIGLFRLRRAP